MWEKKRKKTFGLFSNSISESIIHQIQVYIHGFTRYLVRNKNIVIRMF